MREAGGVPVRRIICCSWFISKASESRGIIALNSASQRALGAEKSLRSDGKGKITRVKGGVAHRVRITRE